MPKHILAHAQGLVYTLLHLMPSPYQQETLQALLGLFLDATGQALPAHSKVKSASAISRFLNQYQWPTRQVIRAVRQAAIEQLLNASVPGRRPYLQVILDLTTLEKTGKFKAMPGLIRVYHGNRGLHLVVMYPSSITSGRGKVRTLEQFLHQGAAKLLHPRCELLKSPPQRTNGKDL